jgi:hypothetical protein
MLNSPVTSDAMDWSDFYPAYFPKRDDEEEATIEAALASNHDTQAENRHQVEFLDIGCGYGGLLGKSLIIFRVVSRRRDSYRIATVELGAMFPNNLSLGMEIRVKVSDYVRERVLALREYDDDALNAALLPDCSRVQTAPRPVSEHQCVENQCNEVPAQLLPQGTGVFMDLRVISFLFINMYHHDKSCHKGRQ